MRNEAGDLARRLASVMPRLAVELLPNGVRDGGEWRVGSLAGEKGRSLGVHLTGARAGVWADFSGGGESGDALDLVAQVRFGGDLKAAMDWARTWLGLPASGAMPRSTSTSPAPAHEPRAIDAAGEGRRAAALAMFIGADPELKDTPADFYLRGRMINLAELGKQPRSLRFHPALHNVESNRAWPAMLAAIIGPGGVHLGTHRTWLHRDSSGIWTKAPLTTPKMVLGGFAGGCIRLWRGASRRPLAHAEPGQMVILAEGIETALSLVIAAPEHRTLCAVSIGNFGRVLLPPTIRTVIIAADDDPNNPAAARALAKAVEHLSADGRAVRIARPPAGFGDFNDVLRAACA